MKEKKCPRCGSLFICNHEDILNCQCSKVKLSKAAQQYIAKNYQDCLCCKCLNEINKEQTK